MADGNLGTLSIDVEVKTAALIEGQRKLSTASVDMSNKLTGVGNSAAATTPKLTATASAIRNLDSSAGVAERSVGRLVKVLGGFIAVQGVGSIITMAESYNEYAERVKMATDSTEEYEKVQKRLLSTANGTYRSLSEAQEAFITSSGAIKDLGYSTDQALDIIDSLSYSFVRNATSAERAKNSSNAISASFASGRVTAMAWQTIFNATPTILNDIATATEKSTEEIRKLGFAGQLTAKDLSEGLRKSLDENKATADGMATTVADAFNNLRNSLAAYLGEANRSTGVTRMLAATVDILGTNIEVLVGLLVTAGAGALAKYISSVGMATIASAKQAIQSRNEAAAALQSAQARNVAAQAALAHARANVGLTQSTAALAAAERTATAATASLATAKKAATAASVGLMGVLGGPAGVIGLVAAVGTGFLAMRSSSSEAKVGVEELTGSLEGLHRKQLDLRQMQLEDAIKESKKAMDETATSVTALKRDYADLQAQIGRGVSVEELRNLSLTIVEQEANLVKLQGEHKGLENALTNVTAAIRAATAAQQGLNNAFDDSQTDDFAKRLEDRKNALIDGNSAVKQTERYIASLNNVSGERIEKLRAEAREIDRLQKALETTKTSTKSYNKAQEEAKRAGEQNANTLQKLAESLALAHLEGEQLAVVQARLSLNDYATPEQLAKAEQLAASLYKVGEANKFLEKYGKTEEERTLKFGQEISPISGGAFDEDQQRYEQELEQERLRNEQRLAVLKEGLELNSLSQEEYYRRMEEAAQVHSSRLAQIDRARNNVMLASTRGAMDDMTAALGAAFGEQSGIFKAAFAVSKAFAIAESIIKIQQGIASAAALPFPANIPAMAMVAAQTAGIVSSIQAVTFGGGRFYGGGVEPNKMYRVNEGGAPEIFNAANGHQYMMPNQRGEVVSNKDATSGGASPQIYINLIENPNKGGQVSQRETDQGEIIDIFVANIRRGGEAAEAIQATYGLQRQGI